MKKKAEILVDFRSDTITLPSPEMRQAMAEAPVGDDVFGEDPTINALEAYVAKATGKQAALFVPSGTMANQIAVRAYGRAGDEILAPGDTHVFFYEAGSAAGLSGVQLHLIPSQNGIFAVEDFKSRIRGDDDHFPRTKAFWVENTHNRGGGRIVPFDLMRQLCALGKSEKIPVHVDGARLVNAAVATGISLKMWGSVCDSLSLCFSKALGAPVGSALAGTKAFIREAHRARKAFGGGMRQAGIIAAGALFALKNNLDRLADDHRRAKMLADGLRAIPGIQINLPVDTNMVMIDLGPELDMSAASLAKLLDESGVRMFDVKPRRLRAVLHLHIDDEGVEQTISVFRKLLNRKAK
jgi:threonine aldolase